MEEENEPKNSVVSVGIISRQKNGKEEYLLISSKKDFGKFTGFFYPPGGHVEEEEDEAKALEREIEEELGVGVDIDEKITESAGDVPNQTTGWWRCKLQCYDFKIQDAEIAEVKWFTRTEILDMENVWPATKNFFNKYI